MTQNHVKALILDMDGVLWRDTEPIGDLAKIFNTIHAKGLKFAFATNNATKSIGQYQEKLASFTIQANPEQIFTSAKATAQTLKSRYPHGGNIYVIGMPGLLETLEESGFKHDLADPLAVVTGLDINITYEKLRRASLLIQDGVPFIGTNPDVSYPTPEGFVPGTGSLLAALQAVTGVAPEIIGKPKPVMFRHALEFLGTAPEETLVVGDRLETDIAGGQAAGCQTGFVLSGVSTKDQGQRWQPVIDRVAPDFSTLIDSI